MKRRFQRNSQIAMALLLHSEQASDKQARHKSMVHALSTISSKPKETPERRAAHALLIRIYAAAPFDARRTADGSGRFGLG